MTVFCTTQVQGIIDLIPGFSQWCEPYSTFEEAWNHCHRGDWMVEFIYRLEPTARALHYIGLRAAVRASTLVDHLEAPLRKALVVKDLWLEGAVADNVVERATNGAGQVSYAVGTLHHFVSKSIADATSLSSTYIIGVSASKAAADATAVPTLRNGGSNLTLEDKAKLVLTELALQADFIRHTYELPLSAQVERRRTRFEREWVI